MPIRSKEHDPLNPLWLIQNFYLFMFGEADGQEYYRGDEYLLQNKDAEITAGESWAAFMIFRKWQIQNLDDFMSL